ncbi:hypothetical protein [Streptomyces sp. NPDC020983]|uniref:DUF7739 domain-containing protein n=1 Tax=Streptomyces sp. NPDC020983 TaxID=3365106 RepID=UPI00379635C5
MGWSYGGPTRSALQFENLARQVAHVLPSGLWRTARVLFDRVKRADGPFEIAPWDAHRIGVALLAAATHPKMPADWGRFARDVAAAADAAAGAGTPWRWS